ncbi:hypothetical protein F5B22DRAFT_415417 [Xylaria bambusicola]|uniref:uncharacterized protein n=1 Tax=Xylaria bambusicola TaxID=326684 RepID=UPI002007560A|nr:uncharacterized protein F5B22DRAFT_415417 [Xylaria bambusicola]KAI0523758.1 hypothetical protein F5B22DRAFT_415417 [Xylaria bambusicola]
MAVQASPNKSRTSLSLAGFPARFKSLVSDMKGLKKDFRHRRRAKSEEVRPKQPLQSTELIPTTTEEDVSISETRSLFRDPPQVRSLSIRVTVKFGEPLNYTHSQDYEGSSSLQPTEELCEALIRRVDHCSKELITRKDSSALDRTGTDGLAKSLRYEIQVQMLRNEIGTGTEAWASRTLRSYQKQPLSTEAAREVILATHYMVGLFLRHHDEAFVWKDGPVRADPVQEQKTFPYQPGRVQPLTSIPRSFFIEKQQDFESIPGYTVHFSITSRNQHRTPSKWHETIEVNSRQLSPLTLLSAENLFLDTCYAVDGVFRAERKEFGALQKACASHSKCQHCQPHDGDGIEMLLSVKNNMGPTFDNLERTTWARVNVFWKDRGVDCATFVEKAKTAIEQVCTETDESISGMNDFEFYIVELRGRGWAIEEPLAFKLGPQTCLCQRTVEALLDRLQTGVADILRGNAIAVRMTARKRGHFILNKTLVAREPIEKPGNKKKSGKAKAYVLDKLKQRIEHDIEMVCKDTCSIMSRDVETTRPNRAASAPPLADSSTNGLLESRRLSNFTATSNRPTTNGGDSVERLASSRGELFEAPEPLGASPSTQDQWTRITRDPATGARVFPLVPGGRITPIEMATSTPEAKTHHPKLSQQSTADTSFDLSVSYARSNTYTTQTSASSVSTTDQYPTGTSLASHKDERQRPTTTGSISIVPRTPDLEFGGSPSIRSSVLVTPNLHELAANNEVIIVPRPPSSGIMDSEIDGPRKVNSFLRKLYAHRTASSPASPLGSRDGSVVSAASRARPVVKDVDLDLTGHDDNSSSLSVGTSSSKDGGAPTSAKSTYDATPIEPIREQETPTEAASQLTVRPAPETTAGKEVFSQSKPEFDFSSPLTITPENSEAAIDEALPPTDKSDVATDLSLQEEIPDPSDDDIESVIPERPQLPQQHRKSFGSAGYLGSFSEPRFFGVGLRGALGGSSSPPSRPPSRPFSRLGLSDEEHDPGQPETPH